MSWRARSSFSTFLSSTVVVVVSCLPSPRGLGILHAPPRPLQHVTQRAELLRLIGQYPKASSVCYWFVAEQSVMNASQEEGGRSGSGGERKEWCLLSWKHFPTVLLASTYRCGLPNGRADLQNPSAVAHVTRCAVDRVFAVLLPLHSYLYIAINKLLEPSTPRHLQ